MAGIRPIDWKGRSQVTNADKYMRNPLNIDLFGYLCSYERLTMMRKLAIAILFTFCLVLTPAAHSQGTVTAATCAQSDVSKVINGPTHVAVDGDTIIIPAGSCTWTSVISVRSGIGISIIGSGTPNASPNTFGAGTIGTSITHGGFAMNPTLGNSLSRISSINFLPATGAGAPITVNGNCTSSGCPNLRLDNLFFPTSWELVGLSDGSVAVVSNVFGVADHNTIGDLPQTSSYIDFLNLGNGSWRGVGSWGDNSWASPDTFGTAQTFYLENNIFNYALGTDTDIGGPNGGGARLACRFNQFNNINPFGTCSGHGTDTTGRPRGVRQWEGYYNTGSCSNAQTGCGSAWPGRSGVGRSFANSFTNSGSGFFKGLANFNAQRTWRGSSWGQCDGLAPWDTNDGTTYYTGTIESVTGIGTSVWTITESQNPGWTKNQWAPNGAPYSFYDVTKSYGILITSNTSNSLTLQFLCESCIAFRPAAGDTYRILRATVCLDQSNRGAGALVSGSQSAPVLASTGAAGPVNQSLDPSYEAADSLPSTAGHTLSGDWTGVIPNRDYYVESVNQSAQTSPTSPFNGTSGTGHGTLTNRPTTCTTGVGYWATDQGSWNTTGTGEQGELFVCTAANNWTLSYSPYTYPHPIIAGGIAGTGGAPNPPTALKVTVQ
jgi:hypothetical protein